MSEKKYSFFNLAFLQSSREMQLPGLTSEACPGPPRESGLLLGTYPPEMHSLQQPGGSLCSASSRPSKSELLSTVGFVWDGKALHLCGDPAAPSLGKDGDHLCPQTLPADHCSYNMMGLMQSQTLSLHGLERIPAIFNATAVSLPAISRGFSAQLLEAAKCQLHTLHE